MISRAGSVGVSFLVTDADKIKVSLPPTGFDFATEDPDVKSSMGGEYSDKEMERIQSQMRKWVAEFSTSNHFDHLSEDQKQESEFIMETFSEFMYSDHGLSPHEWNAMELEECCLETLPRTVSTDEIYFQSIAPVLCAFFAFAEERNVLKNAATLAKRVITIDKQIVKNASDPEHWGISKSPKLTSADRRPH